MFVGGCMWLDLQCFENIKLKYFGRQEQATQSTSFPLRTVTTLVIYLHAPVVSVL